MNERYEIRKVLHEADKALDVYIDKLINATDPLVEQAMPKLMAGCEETPLLSNEATGLRQGPLLEDQMRNHPEAQTWDVVIEKENKIVDMAQREQDIDLNTVQDQEKRSVAVMSHRHHNATDPQKSIEEQNLLSQPAAEADVYSYLQFQVAGLNLAIAQNQILGIHPWPTIVPTGIGRSKWLLGETEVSGHRVKIVDVAMLVIPESRQDALLSTTRPGVDHFMIVGQGDWGLACDKIVGKINPQSTEIQWRSDQGKRPWLAGTIANYRCALLDVGAIARFLENGCWSD